MPIAGAEEPVSSADAENLGEKFAGPRLSSPTSQLTPSAVIADSVVRRAWRALVKSRVDFAPLAIAVGVFALVALLVRPWGDYPLNDDWNFARVVKGFLETGRVVIDTGVAPALVGQTVLAAAFAKIFGFSHLSLRILTMLMALATLAALHSLMYGAKVGPRARTAALVVVAINPLFVNLSFSFMSECYGYAVAIIATAIWFKAVRYSGAPGKPVIGVGSAVLVGFLMGGSFWIRQYCILAYPAVLGATGIRVLFDRDWKKVWVSLPAVVLASVVFIATIRGYFTWAEHSGNFNPNFAGPLAQVFHFKLLDWQVSAGLHLVYLSGFLLPLLLLWPRRFQSWPTTVGTALVCLAFGLCTYTLLQYVGPNDTSSLGLHKVFPFESNIIHNQGIGAMTLSDTFFFEQNNYPVISKHTWELIGAVVIASCSLWALPIGTLGRLRQAIPQRVELLLFGILFSIGSLAAVVQAYGVNGFDRYALPLVFGASLSLATLLSLAEEGEGPRLFKSRALRRQLDTWRARVSVGLFGAAALLLAFFTVAGMHDYFRWNDARWSLVDKAMKMGVPPTSIEGGYEVNGWLTLDPMRKGTAPHSACIGSCRCFTGLDIWSCFDDSYRVWMSVPSDYEEVARETPSYWLGRSRTVYLSRRRL